MSFPGAATDEEFLEPRPWPFRWGVGAFFVLTIFISLGICTRRCGRDDAFLLTALVLFLEIGVLGALIAPRSRRFASGFAAALVVTTVASAGRATAVWGFPVAAAVDAARPLWAPLAKRAERSENVERWIGTTRTQLPTIVHAQRLANALQECAGRYRATDSLSGFPRDARQLVEPTYCNELAAARADSQQNASWYLPGDHGWRWSYVPGPADASGRVASYAIRVYEDPVLERAAPQYEGDESGVIRELVPGRQPSLVASPVQALVQLRLCLQRVPAQHAEDEARYGGYPRAHNPLQEAAAVCPELKGHYTGDYPEREKGRLALSASGQRGEFIDTVAVYQIEFIPADMEGLVFELRATPSRSRAPLTRAGVRRFFVARDGSVHSTTGQGDATESDPVALECAELGMGCGDSPATPRQAPAS